MANPDIAVTIRQLQSALDHAREFKDWVILVCPNHQITCDTSRILAAVVPLGVRFSGRTALIPTGGQVSVIAAGESCPGQDNQKFIVGMVGWGSKDIKDMGWMNHTTRFLTD